MSINSSSAINNLLGDHCSTVHFYMNLAFASLRVILLLPLCTLVLYLGHQRWRQQHCFKTASHADIFTYHMVVMELMWILGYSCYLCGTITHHSSVKTVGLYARYFTLYGGIFFHSLTCVERYLAVIHPITYLSLRNARGVKLRNISTGCVWLLCFGLSIVRALCPPNDITIQLLSILVLSLITVSFCSLSVLCVLVRQGPGEGGGEKEWINQTKRRAFYTITAILSMLWLWCVGLLVNIIVNNNPLLSSNIKCVVDVSANWCNLPSNLVLPLLYLHRAGKLTCCFDMNK